MQCPESAVQQWFSGDPEGSAGDLWNADREKRIGQTNPPRRKPKAVKEKE